MTFDRILPRTRHWPRLGGLLSYLTACFQARRQRVELGQLEPHMLRDIGVTDAAALKESQRPLWDVPKTWRRSCAPAPKRTR